MTLSYKGNEQDNRIKAIDKFPYSELVEMYGYGGNDELTGAFLHSNRIYGGSGNDSINGGADKNWLYGEDGDDTINSWQGGYSQLFGGAGNDRLTGGSNGNILDGGSGSDTLNGGDGSDIYIVDSASDVIYESYQPYWDNDPNPRDMVQASVSWQLGDHLEDILLLGSSSINGTGNALDNKLTGNAADNVLDGGAGVDTAVYSGNRANYTITKNGSSSSVSGTTGTDGIDTVTNVERLVFSDKTIALDISGNAGQAYRLYQAAFDRKPDNDGLKYWISKVDAGVDLKTVAAAFQVSAEFQAKYGTNPTDAQLITAMYSNVLHRAPDTLGNDYWKGQLSSGAVTKDSLLVNFSESNENQVNVIGVIQNGIELT